MTGALNSTHRVREILEAYLSFDLGRLLYYTKHRVSTLVHTNVCLVFVPVWHFATGSAVGLCLPLRLTTGTCWKTSVAVSGRILPAIWLRLLMSSLIFESSFAGLSALSFSALAGFHASWEVKR